MAAINQLTGTKLRMKFSFAEIAAFLLISGQIALYVFMWFQLLNDPSLKTMDFISLYATGRLIRAGDYKQIYNPEAEIVIQREVAGSTYDKPLIFNHPPHVTPILGLIASNDYVRAYIYWTMSGLLVLSACVDMIRRYLLRSGWDVTSAWLGAFGSMTFFPIFISLLGGQDTVYTLIGLLVWMFALLKRDEAFAGLGLAFAALSPTIAGALALPLLASRRRAGWWFIAGMLGLAVYGLALVGWQGVLDFLYLLRTSSEGVYYGINWSAMYNLLGLLARAFPNLSIEAIRLAAWIFATLSILSMCIFWWNKQDRLNIRHIGIAVVFGTFTAPHLHLHGLSFLLLPLLGMVTLLFERGNKKFALVLIPAVSTVLLVILFVVSDWSYASYYLLMLVLIGGLWFSLINPFQENNTV